MHNYNCNVEIGKVFKLKVKADNVQMATELAQTEVLNIIRDLFETQNEQSLILITGVSEQEE